MYNDFTIEVKSNHGTALIRTLRYATGVSIPQLARNAISGIEKRNFVIFIEIVRQSIAH